MKYLIILTYIVLIASLGFFYEDKGELKAMNDSATFEKMMNNYYDVDMPRYPGVQEYPISGEQYINDARMQSSYFVTKDSPLTISSFYRKYWKSQGLSVNSDVTPGGGTVSVYDFNEGVVKNVLIQHERGNVFRVVLSSINSKYMKREFNSFSDLPVYQDSYGFISYELEDPHYRSSVVTYMNRGSIEQNISFYNTSFIRKGWKSGETSEKDNIKMFIFTKGVKEATLTLVSTGKGTTVTVVIKNRR